MERGICIVVIAHNEQKLVWQQLDRLASFRQPDGCHVVIVDNGSQDGLAQSLKEQNEIDYILCEGGIENYAAILNTVVSEFAAKEDLLVLPPHLLILEEGVSRLKKALYQDGATGAVCAGSYAADPLRGKQRELLSLEAGACLLSAKLLQATGGFNESLKLPENIWMDLSFRGICSGFHFYEVPDACVQQAAQACNSYTKKYGADADRETLKKIWGMNYFNQYPNVSLLSMIGKKKTEPFALLEIGCDCGANMMYVKNTFQAASLTGIEINENAAKIAAQTAKVHVCDIEAGLPDFGNTKFDYVVSGDVLEHLKDPERILRECASVLKSDGEILACIPNLMHYSVLHGLLHGNFTYMDTGLLDRTHIHFFTYNEIVKMFVRNGYAIKKVLYTGQKETVSSQEKAFVDGLRRLGSGTEEFMYYAFQYLVSAKKVKTAKTAASAIRSLTSGGLKDGS